MFCGVSGSTGPHQARFKHNVGSCAPWSRRHSSQRLVDLHTDATQSWCVQGFEHSKRSFLATNLRMRQTAQRHNTDPVVRSADPVSASLIKEDIEQTHTRTNAFFLQHKAMGSGFGAVCPTCDTPPVWIFLVLCEQRAIRGLGTRRSSLRELIDSTHHATSYGWKQEHGVLKTRDRHERVACASYHPNTSPNSAAQNQIFGQKTIQRKGRGCPVGLYLSHTDHKDFFPDTDLDGTVQIAAVSAIADMKTSQSNAVNSKITSFVEKCPGKGFENFFLLWKKVNFPCCSKISEFKKDPLVLKLLGGVAKCPNPSVMTLHVQTHLRACDAHQHEVCTF